MTTFSLSDYPGYRVPTEPENDTTRRITSVMPLMCGKARRWLRSMPERARVRYDLEDLMQMAWCKLLIEDHSFDPVKASYPTWAGLIVGRMLNRLGDRICQGPRPKPLEDDLSDAQAVEPPDAITAADDAQAAAQAIQALAQAVERLDDRHFFVLTRSYGVGCEKMTAPQIAAWLARGPAHVHDCRVEAEAQIRAALAG